ncbi:acyltransferase [Lactobacillus delbrueckii]|uniref:acyltransferase n=2 Tax=Lactobacillus delbrueckii TaxID=1584 RepID=UPI0022AE7F01|nr:acyltransferase [Lactobacillus delbrueckii]
MSIVNKFKKILIGYKSSSEDYVEYLRSIGVSVGQNVEIFRPFNTTIDTQNPHLLTIGNDVQITGPVTILTHDYSWSVLKRKYGYIYGNQRKTVIGNNVFIGWGATILGGSQVGDNVIIGANAVVSGHVDSDSVYAGNPAKKLMTLDEFRVKREKKQLEEAKDVVLEYKRRFNKMPPESELDEYFFLFRKDDNLSAFKEKMELMRNYNVSKKTIQTHKTRFKDYQDFLNYCLKEE